jgi:hypothetical protein
MLISTVPSLSKSQFSSTVVATFVAYLVRFAALKSAEKLILRQQNEKSKRKQISNVSIFIISNFTQGLKTKD